MKTQVTFKLRWIGGITTDIALYEESEEPILPEIGQTINFFESCGSGAFIVVRIDGPFILRGRRNFTVEVRKQHTIEDRLHYSREKPYFDEPERP